MLEEDHITLSDCISYFYVKVVDGKKNQRILSYRAANPPINYFLASDDFSHRASKIELIANHPEIEEGIGKIMIRVDNEELICVYKNYNIPKIQRRFNKLDKRIRSRKTLNIKEVKKKR